MKSNYHFIPFILKLHRDLKQNEQVLDSICLASQQDPTIQLTQIQGHDFFSDKIDPRLDLFANLTHIADRTFGYIDSQLIFIYLVSSIRAYF